VLVPFVPIVLALVIALIARHFQPAQAEVSEKMVGMKAPDFSLRDAHQEAGDEPVTLSILTDKSPVLIVFFMGYSCPKCIGHLGALGDMVDDFAQAGVQIIAISPWTVTNTRDSIQTYGDFPFPLLSDLDGKVARAYGLVDSDGQPLHGVFLVDKERRIQFAAKTDHPYTDIGDLLKRAQNLQLRK